MHIFYIQSKKKNRKKRNVEENKSSKNHSWHEADSNINIYPNVKVIGYKTFGQFLIKKDVFYFSSPHNITEYYITRERERHTHTHIVLYYIYYT